LGETTFAYVADEDDNAIRTFDLEARKERAVTRLEGAPAQLMILADGRVAVTLRDKNRVQILEPASNDVDAGLEARCSAPVAAEPFGLAVTPDEARIVVTSAWGKKLSAFDAATLRPAFEVALPREPRAVLVDDDGQRAFVAHVVGATMSVVDLDTDAHAVRAIDLRIKAPRRTQSDLKLRGGCQGFALAKLAKSIEATDDEPAQAPLVGERPLPSAEHVKPARRAPVVPRARVFAPMVTVDPGEAETRSSGYGSSRNLVMAEAPTVSVVDGSAERPLAQTFLADGQRRAGECLLPRAAAVSATRGSLFVTCLGVDALLELDVRGVDPMRLERRRFHVPAGPTGVALDDHATRAVVWSQFDRALAMVSLEGEAEPVVMRAGAVALAKLSPAEAIGRKLFHRTDDPRVSGDGRACASCHPDGREDALTWSTPDGPRQTIMLAGRLAKSAPYSWMGAHHDLEQHLTSTFQRLGGLGLRKEPGHFSELDALVAYISTMRGPTREGEPVSAARAALVARGAALFHAKDQGCASCHPGGGTDLSTHDVGSGVAHDRHGEFDTPSLRFIGGTAPYFHDGRFDTLEALLSTPDAKMGHTLHLSRRDVDALTAYLETL